MQRFLSGFAQSFRNKNDFDEPKTLEDAIQKARYLYEQFNHKEKYPKDWKKKIKLGFKKKGVKPSNFKNYGKNSKMTFSTKSVSQQNFHLIVEIKPLDQPREGLILQRENR
jgi:hypothetical protein